MSSQLNDIAVAASSFSVPVSFHAGGRMSLRYGVGFDFALGDEVFISLEGHDLVVYADYAANGGAAAKITGLPAAGQWNHLRIDSVREASGDTRDEERIHCSAAERGTSRLKVKETL